MLVRLLNVAAICLLIVNSVATGQESSSSDIESRLQEKLETSFKVHPDVVGVLVHVEAPNLGLSWSSAVGVSKKDTKNKLLAMQPVLLASNTKPYVSASILRLVEQKKLKLDDGIRIHLTPETTKLFEEDGYDFAKITIRHLLSHSSGICDYVDDDYFQFVADNPQHQWKKIDQLRRSVRIGNPLFKPGTDHKYGDVNYLLLTEIIEQKTSKPFYRAMRELLKYETLGLKQTWFEGLEPRPKSVLPFAHQYANSRQWDSYQLNPSWDLYGGGGIATNAKEAARFLQLLFNHKIVEDKSLVALMHQRVFPKEKSNYCLGISNYSLDGFNAYYHGGWWGTDVAYCPEANCSVAVFVLERDLRNEFASLGIEFMRMLKDHQAKSSSQLSMPRRNSSTRAWAGAVSK